MTTFGLNVGFSGHLIGGDLLRELRRRGVRMVRHDCLGVGSAEDVLNIAAESVAAEMRPLLVIRHQQAAWLPPSIDAEIWNEPDIGTLPTPRMSPYEYATAVGAAGFNNYHYNRLWAGAISNITVESLRWLEASIRYGWPADVGVSIHWYPPKASLPPNNQHKGFGSRLHEVERLKAVIGDRPFMVSECGYNSAEGLTDQQVLDATRWEVDFWAEQGASALCLYQVNDGPGSGYLDHFGWRDVNGNWKPVSEALTV